MYVLYVFGLAYCCNVCTDTHLCANCILLVDVPQFTLPEKASGSDKGEGDAPYASANTNSNTKKSNSSNGSNNGAPAAPTATPNGDAKVRA